MSERKIGKVISVDSFRVIIQLEDDLKSLYKSGFHDIYEIARINSYVIIPVGADRIVAIVTRIKIQEESEIDRSKGSITLPKAERYLVASMIGTIESGNLETGGKYLQGVYNYPILDNPVWYVVKEDLDMIFDQQDKETLDYTEDYFLPIGTSPAFTDYKIKINPDKLFGKHVAILGNTGSGKSCTVASLIQSLFNYDYDGKSLQSAHFIIFDTNGEYKKAFIGHEKTGNTEQENEKVTYSKKEMVNPFHIDQSGMKVPYWFMNYDDLDYLFQPSPLTQTPVFKNAIGLAKEGQSDEIGSSIPKSYERFIAKIGDSDDLFMQKNHKINNAWAFNPQNEIILFSNEITVEYDSIKQLVKQLGEARDRVTEMKLQEALKVAFNEYLNSKEESKIKSSNSIDLPKYFNFNELISKYIEDSIEQSEGSSQKLRENISTLKLRLHSYLTDERIGNPLILNQKEDIEEGLAKFLAFILGNFSKIYNEADIDIFTKYYSKQCDYESIDKVTKGKVNQITIIDMSLLPFEVLETITGLVGRLILEFVSRFDSNRGKLPIVMVLEEAQNYIPERDKGDRVSISKKMFERIAREGRKYGISLLVSSQRPSELSKTVLSQCNSFIIHRLQNPEDQKYVRQLVSAANEDILQQLPILPQQHAIIMGDAVRTPVQVKINNADPRPNSDNPEFINNWLKEYNPEFPNYKEITEKWKSGDTTFENVEPGTINLTKELSALDTEIQGTTTPDDDDLPF